MAKSDTVSSREGFNVATGIDAPTRALVLCSGGVDSTTLLAMAVQRYGAENVYALSISYGQRHSKEIDAAKAVAKHYGVEQRFLDLSAIFADSNCSLLAHSTQDVPEESYAEQLSESKGKPVSTYVPFRNGLFLSSAASMALSLGCSVLYYGEQRHCRGNGRRASHGSAVCSVVEGGHREARPGA